MSGACRVAQWARGRGRGHPNSPKTPDLHLPLLRSRPAGTVGCLGVEHREEGVEAFRQERVSEDRVRHGGVGELAQHGDRPS